MKKAIHKYSIPVNQFDFVIEMPEGAEILHVNNQFDQFRIWAIVSVDEPVKMETRRFMLLETGEHFQIPAGLRKYITTLITHQGDSVHHLFELFFKSPIS